MRDQVVKFYVKKALIVLAIIVLVSCIGGIGYMGYVMFFSSVYMADEEAQAVYAQDNVVDIADNLIAVYPEEEASVGIIFYPGGNVEAIAYLPLMQKLADEGILCVVVEMPFNMAMLT
ncbi:MAG: alpha/beta hydrolase [Bacillota bacterium]